MSGSHAVSACEISAGIVRGRCGFDAYVLTQKLNIDVGVKDRGQRERKREWKSEIGDARRVRGNVQSIARQLGNAQARNRC